LNSTPRRILALLPVTALALILTLLCLGGDSMRAMLQVSALPTPAPFISTLELPTPEDGQPTLEVPTLAPPTSVPLPAEAGPTPTPWGFLPAPTIVNPNDLKSLPIAQPPVSSAGSSIEPTGVSTRAPAGDPTVRAVVELINYLWLLCGGAIVVGGAVAIFILWRRSQRT
jgi:hypothetical protein